MPKMEKMKKNIIKKANLDTIEKTEKLINKYLEKMTYQQLLNTLDYVEGKIIKNGSTDANITFKKLVEEMIDTREKEMSKNATTK